MRISDWSSDVCSSDLLELGIEPLDRHHERDDAAEQTFDVIVRCLERRIEARRQRCNRLPSRLQLAELRPADDMHGGIVPGRHMELRRFVPARRNVCVRAMEYRNRMPVRALSPAQICARHITLAFVAPHPRT